MMRWQQESVLQFNHLKGDRRPDVKWPVCLGSFESLMNQETMFPVILSYCR